MKRVSRDFVPKSWNGEMGGDRAGGGISVFPRSSAVRLRLSSVCDDGPHLALGGIRARPGHGHHLR